MNGSLFIKDQAQAIAFFKYFSRTQPINEEVKAIAYLIKPGNLISLAYYSSEATFVKYGAEFAEQYRIEEKSSKFNKD